MTSDSLIQQMEQLLGLSWSAWFPLSESSILDNAPDGFGIYKIRLQRGGKISRLVGESEIVCIGSSGMSSDSTLRYELLKFTWKEAHITCPRAERLQKELRLELEFSFAKVHEVRDAKKMLLMAYEREHYELPPLN